MKITAFNLKFNDGIIMTQIITEEDGILHKNGIILGSFIKGDKNYKQDNIEITYCTEEEALQNGLTYGV